MLDKSLNFRRIGQLLLCDLRNTWFRSVLLLAGLLVASVLFFQVTINDSSFTQQTTEWLMDQWVGSAKFHISYFPAALLIGGIIFTSFSFWELTRKPSRQFFLSLPASCLEKWVSKWLLSAIIFPLIWMVLYQFFALYTYSWFRGVGFEMVHLPLTDPWVWKWFFVYLLVQSLFLLGAVWMPRLSLIKSVLLIAGISGICMSLYQFGLYTLMPLISEDLREMASQTASGGYQFRLDSVFQNQLYDQYPFWFKIIFGLFLTPIALLISFLKLQEKEA